MARDLVTFTPDTDLFIAIRQLLHRKVSGAPVVNNEGLLVGMLSEVDCLRAILALTYHEEEFGGKVSQYMSQDICTIEYDADIIKVAESFIKNGLRRLPVVQHGRLIGQISRRDVLRAVEVFAQDG
jgi:CBS domain-containing protein